MPVEISIWLGKPDMSQSTMLRWLQICNQTSCSLSDCEFRVTSTKIRVVHYANPIRQNWNHIGTQHGICSPRNPNLGSRQYFASKKIAKQNSKIAGRRKNTVGPKYCSLACRTSTGSAWQKASDSSRAGSSRTEPNRTEPSYWAHRLEPARGWAPTLSKRTLVSSRSE